MIVGIDIGSTTTKAVVIESNAIVCRVKARASDPITSAAGIIGKITLENGIDIRSISKIIVTGVGSTKINKDIFNIETGKVDEISAIGKGGLFLIDEPRLIIANIGTGTVFIEADKAGVSHLGGTGVGGGTIIGLSKKLLKVTDFNVIMKLAERGDIKNVDLQIGDIVDTSISFLNREATASNFAKMLDTATDQDIAMGILNLTYQVIGMLAIFAARGKGTDKVIVTGNGSNNAIGKRILNDVADIYKMTFVYPEDAEFTTAIGAALSA